MKEEMYVELGDMWVKWEALRIAVIGREALVPNVPKEGKKIARRMKEVLCHRPAALQKILFKS